jgi:hypothetical protein
LFAWFDCTCHQLSIFEVPMYVFYDNIKSICDLFANPIYPQR